MNIILRWNQIGRFTRTAVIKILAKHWFFSNQQQTCLSRKADEDYQTWKSRKDKISMAKQREHLKVLLQMRMLEMVVANFHEVKRQVFAALNETFRASSLVESTGVNLRHKINNGNMLPSSHFIFGI